MKSSHAVLGAGALMFALGLAIPTKPAVVATVDVERVFQVIQEAKANDARISKLRDTLTAERTGMGEELKALDEELKLYKSGSAQFVAQSRKIEEKIGAMRSQEEFGKYKLEAESAQLMRDMYEHMKQSVATLAQQNNIDYVIVDDSLAKIEVAGMQATKQQMALRRMLYANTANDITNDVVTHMDAQFKATASAAPTTP